MLMAGEKVFSTRSEPSVAEIKSISPIDLSFAIMTAMYFPSGVHPPGITKSELVAVPL